jgi:hypothetical protein
MFLLDVCFDRGHLLHKFFPYFDSIFNRIFSAVMNELANIVVIALFQSII